MPVTEKDDLITDEEMFILTPDDLRNTVPDDVAMARGDIPPEDTLEKPVELVLDEDKDDGELPPETDGEEDKPELKVEQDDDADLEAAGDQDQQQEDELEKKEPELEEPTTPKDVPYGRLADKLDEISQLKARIADLEAGRQETPPKQEEQQQEQFNLNQAYKEYAEYVADGDTELAAETMAKIDAYKDQVAEARITQTIERREIMKAARTNLDGIMNENPDFFGDPINVQLFTTAKQYHLDNGKTLDEAVVLAGERFFPKEKAPKPSADNKEPSEADKAAALKAEKDKKALTENAKANSQQPPSMEGGSGNRNNPQAKKDAFSYSESEYRQLPKSKIKQDRGDYVS